MPVVCECVIAAQEAERRAKDEAARQEAVRRRFKESWLPAQFEGATLEGFAPRPGTERALALVQEYANRWPEQLRTGEGLILMGDPGNGKSHLAAAIVRHVCAAGGVAIFAGVPRLMVRFEATYRAESREHEADLLQTIFDADLLVLDDLGAEKITDKRRERLYLIVDTRTSERRPTIVTTNCRTVREMEDQVGEKVMDRLLGACVLAQNKGTSYRQEQARKRIQGVTE